MTYASIAFGVCPYVAIVVFIVGHVWRWKQDQFGWTSRTSQLMEKRWLMIGSPLFHVGALLAVLGHAMGLLVPAWLTEKLGVSDHVYHLMAVTGGVLAGVLLLSGLAILLLRRFITKARLRVVTRRADIVMYIVLGLTAVLGFTGTLVNVFTAGHDYRSTVAIWFRSVFTLQPDVAAMAASPWYFQAHAVCACAVLAVWPFSRLVHVWSVPLGYLIRPRIVYHTSAE
ncbi:MAG: respiratory nitrate reductase subunit gamma [Propionibacteriaceae bacterium]|nr:respiratory nitrate reductase subunit gamma [Propionibacteriaceae bacterium]